MLQYLRTVPNWFKNLTIALLAMILVWSTTYILDTLKIGQVDTSGRLKSLETRAEKLESHDVAQEVTLEHLKLSQSRLESGQFRVEQKLDRLIDSLLHRAR